MCGIFGLLVPPAGTTGRAAAMKTTKRLFVLSQSRGKEASGLMCFRDGQVAIAKSTRRAQDFIRSEEFRGVFAGLPDPAAGAFALIGHARLDTNGSKWDNANNSPLQVGDCVGVHNGIITNVDALWAQHPGLQRQCQVDSEYLVACYDALLRQGLPEADAIRTVFAGIKGSASVALLSASRATVALATNTGSLYLVQQDDGTVIFASESYILRKAAGGCRWLRAKASRPVLQVKPGEARVFSLSSGQFQ